MSPSSRQRSRSRWPAASIARDVVEREAAVEEGAHALLQRDLVVGELEVHQLSLLRQAEHALADDVAVGSATCRRRSVIESA